MLISYLCSFLLIGAAVNVHSITVKFSSNPTAIEPLRPVTLMCDISNYNPGSSNYSVSFFRGHVVGSRNLIATHDVFSKFDYTFLSNFYLHFFNQLPTTSTRFFLVQANFQTLLLTQDVTTHFHDLKLTLSPKQT